MKSKFYKRLSMVFTIISMFTFIANSQTTLSIQISNPSDDHEESRDNVGDKTIGSMDEASSDLELTTEKVRQYVGCIFRNVQIPPTANISNAYIQFTADDVNSEVITIDIYGAAEANVSAPFTEDPFGISSHPSTVATVSWIPDPWVNVGDAGEAQRTPDISTIITEIIRGNGWAPGNNLMIIFWGSYEGTGHREAVSGDGNLATSAILNVTFTEGTGINSTSADYSSLIYPNPTESELYISCPSADKFSYEIFNVTGQLVLARHDITGSTVEVDISCLAKGIYYVSVRSEEKTETHKLILK